MSSVKNITKIIFLNPPDPSLLESDKSVGYEYFEPPLGLLYVYDFIKKRGDVDVKFLDLNIEMKFLSKNPLEDTLRKHIQHYSPDMIAVATLYYSGIHVFHLISKYIKQIDPSIVVIFGGHYPHHLTELCLKDENIDFSVLSEGELGLSGLIDALKGKCDVQDVEGIAYRRNGIIKKNVRKRFWRGFSDLKRLPWEDTPFIYYFREGRNLLYRVKRKEELRLAAITASRGCPNKCTFCTSPSFWNGQWRKRRISHIVSEIEYLKNCYDVNTIVFNDENIGVDKKWFIELLDSLIPLKVSWISSGGFAIRTINDEVIIQKMYESGIAFFNIAAESGSNEVLQRIRKPLTIEETENVIYLIRKHGNAFINSFFITGFPFENLESVKRTLRFAESVDTDWKGFYCFRPLPGSEIYKYARDIGLISDFEPQYGELYFAPEFEHLDYTSQQLTDLSYLANLKNNFVNNRNLKLGSEESLSQAERDFRYVLDMVPDHVFAYLGLAEIMRKRNQLDHSKEFISKARGIVYAGQFKWKEYLESLNIDIDGLYKDIYYAV